MRPLPQPSMVCNDFRMVEDEITCFRMENSWLVPSSATPHSIITHVANVAQSTSRGRLHCLILHCHGSAARMTMGCGSFGHENVSIFKNLQNKVDHIFLVSCSVASQGSPGHDRVSQLLRFAPVQQAALNQGLRTRDYIYRRLYNGVRFCEDIASNARCLVTAADRVQVGVRAPFLPMGLIDDFEGLSRTWNAERQIVESHFAATPR